VKGKEAMMTPAPNITSSYLRYLPPALWGQEAAPPAFSLGTMLLIFEKLLTGIQNDPTGIPHGDHQHQAIEETIATLYQLFDPWRTPARFLPWLASWLGLTLVPTWDEYQCRKAIAEITQIYRQRGLKSALQQYLSLYTVIETRPRIAIDDGSKLLFTQPTAQGIAEIHSLVSQSYFVPDTLSSYAGLIRPWYLATAPDPDGSILIGDRGTAGIYSPSPVSNQLWHLDAAGTYAYSGKSPAPQPLNIPLLNLANKTIGPLTVRMLPSGDWELYVLTFSGVPDSSGNSGTLYRIPYTLDSAAVVTNFTQKIFTPIAMVVDTNNDLLILERGDGTSSIEPTPTPSPTVPALPPGIIRVQLSASTVTPARKAFQQVLEPLSLLVLPNGNLIVGDAGKQTTATGDNLPATDLPANLIYVDRLNDANWNDANWQESPLPLGANNPLVAPTALIRADDSHLFVLDVGLKPFAPSGNTPFITDVAEPAAIYQVALNLTQVPPPVTSVTRLSEAGNMVYPTAMVMHQGKLLICDAGQSYVSGTDINNPPLPYRLHPHEFGVVLHFCNRRLPSDPQAQQEFQYQIIADIKNIIDQEKPAHTLYQLVTEIAS
jgi:phage tail-like protein